MRLSVLCTALLLTAIFAIGPKISLEAGHHHKQKHVSYNIGTVFPSYPRTYVVERPRTTYVKEHHYYPARETVTVYHEQPVEKVYVYPERRSSCCGGLAGGLAVGLIAGVTAGLLLR